MDFIIWRVVTYEMANQVDLVEIVTKLEPLAVIKG